MSAIEQAEEAVRKLGKRHEQLGTFFDLWGTKEREKKVGALAAMDSEFKPWVCYTLMDGRPIKADRFKRKFDALAYGKWQRENVTHPRGMKVKVTTITVQANSRQGKLLAGKLPEPKQFKAKEPPKKQLGLGL